MARPRGERVVSEGGAIRVEFDVPRLRDSAGRFVSGVQGGLQRWAAEQAREVQASVVTQISTSLVRPKVSTGRLVRATANTKNRRSGLSAKGVYFQVGIHAYMNQSIAKYWRTIEEGSAKTFAEGGKAPMIGRELRGIWGGTITGFTPERAFGGPPFSRFGRATGGKFIPSARGQKGEIGKEIDPMGAYGRAWAEHQPGRRGIEEVRRLLKNAAAGN